MASGRTHLHSLTGLRWMAALLVFFLHIQSHQAFLPKGGLGATWLTHAMAAGRSGVSFFYILSGFVLAWSVRPADTRRAFWWRRLAKVYPNHFVTFFVALLVLAVIGGRLPTPEIAVANLFLLHSWVPNRPDVWYSVNGTSWSLVCEAFFYLCFPLFFAALRRLGTAGWWVVVVGGTLAVTTLPYVVKHTGRPFGWSETFLLYQFPPVRMAEFVVGAALALLVRSGAWRGPGMMWSGLVVVAGMIVAATLPPFYGPARDVACTMLGFVLLIAAAAVADVRQTRSIWRTRTAVWLGEVSFAFYMVHQIVLKFCVWVLLGHPLSGELAVAAVLVTLALALGCAAALHTWVEKPMMRLLTRRRAAPAPVIAQVEPV